EMAVPYSTLKAAGIDPDAPAINAMCQNLSGVGERFKCLADPGRLDFGRCQEFLAVVTPAPEAGKR
ncbi:hypothetical protein ACFLQU_05685, partial [Verrucomicrobiota bacterium]